MSLNLNFPIKKQINPKIYAYKVNDPQYDGLLKIGYTERDVRKRIDEQFNIKDAGTKLYTLVLEETAVKNNGSVFSDREVHKLLERNGYEKLNNSEWYRCEREHVLACISALKTGSNFDIERIHSFSMRPEQNAAVRAAFEYFKNSRNENKLSQSGRKPKFLWNAKMRFGKTFAAYKLIEKMNWKKVLILTFKPAVRNAWQTDLETHTDFAGWQFFSNTDDGPLVMNERPLITFGSLQDYLGRDKNNNIKKKNKWAHRVKWDCVVFDEYHFGAWREDTKDLVGDAGDAYDDNDPDLGESIDENAELIFKKLNQVLQVDSYLYLSGTPFRALATGEFIEEQIFNWTYVDEQEAKSKWVGPDNPYATLPKVNMLTYQLPDDLREVAYRGEFNQFSLNEFFSTNGIGETAKFKHEEEVQKWLEMIRGEYLGEHLDVLKILEKPLFPFSTLPFLNALQHTFWYLPNVAACHAMKNQMLQPANKFYSDFDIIVAAGESAGIGAKALQPVIVAMGDGLKTKTITLSCNKLTTGVSVPPWTGIFFLRDISSPESYFQAAFRVQTPWTIPGSSGTMLNLKPECFIFDFSPERALRLVSDYACKLDVNESIAESKIEEFIKFLPILAFNGTSMRQVDAEGVLDIATAGISATLLARRWDSPQLINLNIEVIKVLTTNQKALKALMSIEGFRNINKDFELIISREDSLERPKSDSSDKDGLIDSPKKSKSKEEKEFASIKKQIRDKLIKFISRIPIFMYLTDYRELALKHVIERVEPDLFTKVTGISKEDFSLLVDLGLFNAALLDDAIWKFKRYEDASFSYAGVRSEALTSVRGLWDTVITDE